MSAPSTLRRDVAASAPQWGLATLLAAAATWWLAGAWDPRYLVHGVLWLAVGFVLLPLAFAVALAAVALVLTGILGALALPFRLAGRPTGLRGLLAELWRIPGRILPDYWRAVRSLRRPVLWGAMAGAALGIAAFALVHGLAPR